LAFWRLLLTIGLIGEFHERRLFAIPILLGGFSELPRRKP
jgi:hypothetical protein